MIFNFLVLIFALIATFSVGFAIGVLVSFYCGVPHDKDKPAKPCKPSLPTHRASPNVVIQSRFSRARVSYCYDSSNTLCIAIYVPAVLTARFQSYRLSFPISGVTRSLRPAFADNGDCFYYSRTLIARTASSIVRDFNRTLS